MLLCACMYVCLTLYVGRFDMTMRYRLASLNEKLNRLERSLEYCEAAVKSAVSAETDDN